MQKTPPDWGQDDLAKFLDNSRHNVFASYVQLHGPYRRLRDIDATYRTMAANLLNARPVLSALLFLKTHASFLASAHLALAGQRAEAHMTMRGCLESALYGLFVAKRPDVQEIWLRRSETNDTKAKAREAFKIGPVFKSLQKADVKTHHMAKSLYDITIDYGAHPNEGSLSTALDVQRKPGRTEFQLAYLSADRPVMLATLRVTSQVGLCALKVMGNVFPERYKLLGLDDRINKLMKSL